MNIKEMISAYGGMIFGKEDYWHPNMKVSKKADSKLIKDYYVDTRPKSNYPGIVDKEGIPLMEIDGKVHYSPVTIAQYALGNFDMYTDTNEEKYIEVVKKCADWFVENTINIKDDIFGLTIGWDNEIYNLPKPWISALAQGQAISVLARYYSYSKKNIYIDSAMKYLSSFEKNVENGGVLASLNNNCFYEEYPSKEPSFVLNGFIFSLWGLLDLYIVGNNKCVEELYNKGLQTLENNLYLYNIKGICWSKYDLYPFKINNIASIFYHKLHIEQLKAMYNITQKPIYRDMYLKWEKAAKNPFKYWAATGYKIIHKISVSKNSKYVASIK
jgi:heparosan-N-sulfate-glucuronate 5-epimerase